MRELQQMSFSDPLTHLGNRFALEDYLKKLDKSEPIGIVYCDISGLKRVNDEQGHLAGDSLICKAAGCLMETFHDYGLFRIGGDELLVICTKVDENTFDQYVQKMLQQAERSGVAIATGSVWKETSDENIDHLMTEAERRMYNDKEAYYEKRGLKRRIG